MSLVQILKDLNLRLDHVLETQPAFFAAATFDMFEVTGGPVIIKCIVEYMDTAMTNVTTTTWNFETLALDNGAVAIDASVIGSIVVVPLDTTAKPVAALGSQGPLTTAAVAANTAGFVCGLGNIDVTFATVMDGDDRYSAHLVYQKLGKNSLVRALF